MKGNEQDELFSPEPAQLFFLVLEEKLGENWSGRRCVSLSRALYLISLDPSFGVDDDCTLVLEAGRWGGASSDKLWRSSQAIELTPYPFGEDWDHACNCDNPLADDVLPSKTT